MPANPPINFEALAKSGGSPATGGYPYSIKSEDLNKNFVFATLDIAEGVYEEVTGMQGHRQRRLKIPTPPGSGTHVLGTIGGQIQWIATEECA